MIDILENLKFVPVYTSWRFEGSQRNAGIKGDKEVQTPGVYFIKFEGQIIYIGFGSNVHRVLYRHFHNWTDRRYLSYGVWERKHVYNDAKDPASWHKYEVAIFLTETKELARLLERMLICKYCPRDNLEKYEWYMTPQEEALSPVKTEGEIKEEVLYHDDNVYPF